MDTIQQCVWKIGNEHWDINIPDYTNQNPAFLAETVVELFLNRDSNPLSGYFKNNNIDPILEEYIYVENDVNDNVYEFSSEEIVNKLKNK